MNDKEKAVGVLPVVTAKTQEKTVTVIKGKGRKQIKSSYSFDNVFTAFSTQEEVFEATVKPVIVDVMRGFESTVFAYGQTGTGKTHTMEGSLSSPDLYGVIPRSAQAIFEHLRLPQYKNYDVTCSYLEIYNEELRDLLADNSKTSAKVERMDIMEGKTGTSCRGLTEKPVQSAEDVLSLMQKAQHSRMIGETKMNKASSRSHCLFTIQVKGKISLLEDDGDMEFTGKLHMVDLAGSECAKSAGNDRSSPDAAARERERLNINRSLLTLGRVITTLKEKSLNKNTNARIPYRDSKLTRVLREALGGRCKTVIVATISPSITAIEESLSTLSYAYSATGIMNKPVSSSLIALGGDVPAMSSDSKLPPTIESWQEMEMRLQYMNSQVEEAQAALARKHLAQQELQDRAEKAEQELLGSKQMLYDANRQIKSLHETVESEVLKRKQTEQELRIKQIALRKTEHVLTATQATETSLTAEAQALIARLEDIVSERDQLHAIVVSQRNSEEGRREATNQFQKAALQVLDEIESSFTRLSACIETAQTNAIESAELSHEAGRLSVSETHQLITNIAKNVTSVTASIQSQLVGDDGVLNTLNTQSSSIMNDVKGANDAFVCGEQSFEESQLNIRAHLEKCTKLLDQYKSSTQLSTSEALQAFETKIVESKDAIGQLVMRIKSAMANLAEAKTEKTGHLESIVSQWRNASLEKSKAAGEAAASGSGSLKASIEAFQNGMHCNHEMQSCLSENRSFLEDTASFQVESIHNQNSLLDKHRQRLTESHDAQAELRVQVMESIMSGVQALVSSEIQKLATSQSAQYQLLAQDGAKISDAHEKIASSAQQVIERSKETNSLMSEKVACVITNAASASDAMRSSQNTLEQMLVNTNEQYQLASDFASKSLCTLSDVRQIDQRGGDIVKFAERDGKSCVSSLVNSVFRPTSDAMKQSLNSSLSAANSISNTIVENVVAEFSSLAQRREVVATQLSNRLDNASANLNSTAQVVTANIESQNEVLSKLQDDVLTTSKIHEQQTVPYYHAELDSGKEKVVSCMASLSDASSKFSSGGKLRTSDVKLHLSEFANNQMSCTDPVDPAPERRACDYSSALSSTPAEAEILSNIDLGDSQVDEEDDSSTLPVATKLGQISHKEGTSLELHEDDDASNGSRKSSGGSIRSIPSPRLRFRDVNQFNLDPTSQAATKMSNHPPPRKEHSRPNSSSIPKASINNKKNKQIPGLPNPSRKRMKR